MVINVIHLYYLIILNLNIILLSFLWNFSFDVSLTHLFFISLIYKVSQCLKVNGILEICLKRFKDLFYIVKTLVCLRS